MAKSTSPGNIFIFGEHAVVYGKPAIIASVNLRTTCIVKKKKDKVINIFSREFGEASSMKNNKNGRKELFVLLDLCKNLLIKFGIQGGLEVKIKSEIPPQSGLSSSTAVLCGVLCSFVKLFKINISQEDYYDYLIDFQKEIHGGRASGAEIISSSLGGFNYISFTKNKTRISNLGTLFLKIVIGDTQTRKETSKTVGGYVSC